MSGKYECCIDKARLGESIKTLEELDNSLNNNYLVNNLIEIEEIIKTLNINHNNCISNYKEKIDNILYNIQELKKEMNKLNTSVAVTLREFSEADQFKTKDIEDIFGKFDNKTDVASLAVNNNLKIAPNIQEFRNNLSTSVIGAVDSTVNTVPIGLGIGAAGITASIGAVVVDSMNKPKHETFEEYKEPKTHEEMKFDYNNLNRVEEERNKEEEKEAAPTPYFASRDKFKNDKFYDDIK